MKKTISTVLITTILLLGGLYALAVVDWGAIGGDDTISDEDLSDATIDLQLKIISQSIDSNGYHIAYDLPVRDASTGLVSMQRATSTYSAEKFNDCGGTQAECITELETFIVNSLKAQVVDKNTEMMRQKEEINAVDSWSAVQLKDISISEEDIND